MYNLLPFHAIKDFPQYYMIFQLNVCILLFPRVFLQANQ